MKRLWHFDSFHTQSMHFCQQHLDTKPTLANGYCLGLFYFFFQLFILLLRRIFKNSVLIQIFQPAASQQHFFFPPLHPALKGFKSHLLQRIFFFWPFLPPRLCPDLEHSSKHSPPERYILCSLIPKFFNKEVRHTAVLTKLFL